MCKNITIGIHLERAKKKKRFQKLLFFAINILNLKLFVLFYFFVVFYVFRENREKEKSLLKKKQLN